MINEISPIRYSCIRPQQVERENVYGFFAHTVNYDITELPPDDPAAQAGYEWSFRSVRLEPGVWSYDAIVSAIIRAEYPSDRMEAVVNNYLVSPDEGDHRAEFTTLQEHRAKAKRVAREVISLQS